MTKEAFTLLETLLSIILISFIFLFLFIIVINLFNLNTFLVLGLGNEGKVLLVLKTMEKEMLSMENSHLGAYPLEEASSTRIVFYSDIDGDGLIEKIIYYLEGDSFKKGIIKPSGQPLTYSSSNLVTSTLLTSLEPNQKIFTFYDKFFQETQNIHLIKTIKISFRIKKGKEIFEYYTIISPRNLIYK